jgi:flagellar hook-associated protein 2
MALTINKSLRLSGLSSGLDTDTIVKGLMSGYQLKLDQQSQKTTKLQWTADAYREINTLIKSFREKHLSVLSSMNMMSEAAYSSYTVNMLTTTDAASVSVSSSAQPCTVTINSITQLAEAANLSSVNAFTGTTYLSDATLDTLELANPFEFDENDELAFSINGQTFTFTKDTTIAAMVKQINASDLGVTMRYSTLSRGFSLTSDTTGSASTIAIVNLKGNAFAAENSALGIAEQTKTGKDAICTINDIPVTQSANSFTYDGITYTLNNTSPADTPIKFSVSQDYQSTVDSIASFIDAYNQLVDSLQSKLSEKVYSSYAPLTDTQKEEMTEKEIEKWEGYAKSGMLHNDSYISSLLTTFRSAFYTQVEGTGMRLSDIGLTTGTYSDGAKITVDKGKLLSALKENPQNIKDIFTEAPTDGDFSDKGLMVRISDALLTYTKQTTDIALDSLETRISDSEDRKDQISDRLEEKEAALWTKFSAMESALAQLNGMSNWLSTLFSSN